MTPPSARPGHAESTAGAARRWGPLLVLTIALGFSYAWAQPRAEVVLGPGGAPVTGAWNPLRAVVRDAPGARLTVEVDVGGLARGEVLRTATWTFPDASGVQRLDVDLPLPEWRRLTWRVEHGERLLASGGLGVRERDPRPLALIVSATPPSWYDALAEDLRPVPAASADLPSRAASWDGVALLLFDGTAAAPDAATVLAAAAAGVRVLLPDEGSAGYAALAPLLEPGGTRAGAGGIERLDDPRPDGRFGADPVGGAAALPPSLRRDLVAAAAAALPATRWSHLPRFLVAAVSVGYSVAAWTLFRVGGPAGVSSGLLVVVAAFLTVPLAAPGDRSPVSEGAVVVAAGGLGVRTDLREVATLPRGDAVLDGIYLPSEPIAVTWSEGTTRLPLEPGGRARLTGPPHVVYVPDDVRERATGAATEVPEELERSLPAGVRPVASGATWWLLRTAGDEASADAGGAGAPVAGVPVAGVGARR